MSEAAGKEKTKEIERERPGDGARAAFGARRTALLLKAKKD